MELGRSAFSVLAALAIVLLGSVCSAGAPPPDSGAPTAIAQAAPRLVVLIVVDTLRADHLGAYGSDKGLTPAMDLLAGRSLLFERAIATSSWTRSSVASLLTSRFPSGLGVLDREDALADEALTLAEVFAGAGWRTAAVSSNGNAGPAFGFDQGFERFEEGPIRRGYRDDFKMQVARGITGRAIELIEEADAAGARLFLFLHYTDPHDPYLRHRSLDPGPEPPGRFSGARYDLERLDALPADEVTEADRARIRHLYEGEVRYVDLWIGHLLEGLERTVGDEAVVVLTADHGEGLWDHGVRRHGIDLHQEQVHVPLIIHLPGMDETDGRRLARPLSLIEVAPAILEACALPIPPEYRGRGLGSWLATAGDPGAAAIYTELTLDDADFEALLVGRHKLIRRRDLWRLVDPDQLYDLAEDPGERVDLTAAGPAPDEIGPLRAALARAAEAAAADRGASRTVDESSLDDATRESLRALGYLE